MKTLRLITIAVSAVAFSTPVLASGDAAQLAAQKRAHERLNTQSAAAGGSAPSHKVDLACNLKQPSERVRR